MVSLRGVPEYKVGSVEEGCTRTDGFGVVDRDVAYQVSATAEEGMGNLRRRVSSNGVLSLIICIDTGCLKSHLTRISGAFHSLWMRVPWKENSKASITHRSVRTVLSWVFLTIINILPRSM